MRFITLLSLAAVVAAPAYAADPVAGERLWRNCQACHMIVDDAGEVLARGGRVGPNLYRVVGRPAASIEGFRYSADLTAAGEAGLVWDTESFQAYTANPTAFLREYLDKPSARGAMAFQLRSGAEDMYAYLKSVSGQE
jgi:cytochrome c